jgi:3-methyladenine DNA glycosylase AlkD
MIETLRRQLAAQADAKTKAWWEAYVKGSAPFLGLKMAAIRTSVHRWYRAEIRDRLELDEQADLALALVREAYTEEKLAGMLLIDEILIPAGAMVCEPCVRRFGPLFSDGYIYDWNVCDWFCIKVLGPLIARDGPDCARAISEWRDAENLWQARASVVAFVILADESGYYPMVLSSCKTLIRREERFAKTAVGWILRDIARRDAGLVEAFVEKNLPHFSAESIRSALKHFAEDHRDQYLSRRRASRRAMEAGGP